MLLVVVIFLAVLVFFESQKKKELKEVVDKIPAGIIRLSKQRKVLYFNDHAKELCGDKITMSFDAFLSNFSEDEKRKLNGALKISLAGQRSTVTTSFTHEIGAKVFLDFHFLPFNEEILATVHSSNFLGHAKEYLETEKREISKLSRAVARELANATFSINGSVSSNDNNLCKSDEQFISDATQKIETISECLSHVSDAYLSRNYEVPLAELIPEIGCSSKLGEHLVDASVTQYLLNILCKTGSVDFSTENMQISFSSNSITKHEEILANYFARLLGATLIVTPNTALLQFGENNSRTTLIENT